MARDRQDGDPRRLCDDKYSAHREQLGLRRFHVWLQRQRTNACGHQSDRFCGRSIDILEESLSEPAGRTTEYRPELGELSECVYNGLPSSLLRLGDVLNEPVSDHPQYLPFPTFDTSLTVAQALRPYPQYGRVDEQFPYNTNSNYNSLQVTVTRHLTSNLGFLAAYTFSKAIGYIDANGPGAYYTSVQDYFNRGLDRSITEFSTPHEFKLT